MKSNNVEFVYGRGTTTVPPGYRKHLVNRFDRDGRALERCDADRIVAMVFDSYQFLATSARFYVYAVPEES